MSTPRLPTRVDATNGSHPDGVIVEWVGSVGATGYRILRSLSQNLGDAVVLGVVGSGGFLWFIDDTVVPDTRYYYWVVAYNGEGDSEPGGPDLGYAATPVLRPIVCAPSVFAVYVGS